MLTDTVAKNPLPKLHRPVLTVILQSYKGWSTLTKRYLSRPRHCSFRCYCMPAAKATTMGVPSPTLRTSYKFLDLWPTYTLRVYVQSCFLKWTDKGSWGGGGGGCYWIHANQTINPKQRLDGKPAVPTNLLNISRHMISCSCSHNHVRTSNQS